MPDCYIADGYVSCVIFSFCLRERRLPGGGKSRPIHVTRCLLRVPEELVKLLFTEDKTGFRKLLLTEDKTGFRKFLSTEDKNWFSKIVIN